MTALKKFDRLESIGLWKKDELAQRIEVIVSFGNSTLVLSDKNENPITHWSLAAIIRLGSNQDYVVFSVDKDCSESLEINDSTMIMAIDEICLKIQKTRPKHGRLRIFISSIVLIGFILSGIFWLPKATARYAAKVIPETKVEEISALSLKYISQIFGPVCSTVRGERSLRFLEERLLKNSKSRIFITKMEQRKSALLLGGNILISDSVLKNQIGAELLASYVLLETIESKKQEFLYDLFLSIGVKATIIFLTTGEINSNKLSQFSQDRILRKRSLPEAKKLLNLLNDLEVSSKSFVNEEPYYRQSEISEHSTEDFEPLLRDVDWLELQQICD